MILAIILLWQPIVSYYLNSCLTGYCKEYLKGDLEFQGISRQNGKWVVDGVFIDTEHRKFNADQVLVEFGLSPFSREVDVNVVIKNPQIDIQKKTSELQAFLLDCLPFNLSNWAFNVNSSLVVEEGTITWHPVTEEDQTKQIAIFRLNGSCKRDDIQGKLVLEVEKGNTESNIFEMIVSKRKDSSMLAELNFREVNCFPLCEAAKGFGFPFRGWNITDGVINGKVSVLIEGEKRPQVMGKAILHGLVFHHPDVMVQGDIQEARLDIRAEDVKDGHLGIVGKVEITEDASVVLLNEGVPYWEIQRLKGGVYFQGKDLAIVDVEGKCTHRDSTFGLNIDGDVRFPDAFQSSIDIAIELISPDENVASARFLARQLGTMHNTAEIELKNIGKEEFTFVQTALSRYSPDWKNIQMLNGGIDARGTIFMQRYKVTEINIDHIAAERLKFEVLPWETTMGFAKASGQLSMSMLKEDLLESINAQVFVEGGNAWAFTNVSTDFRVNDGVIQKSVLKGEFAGLNGTVELDWMSTDDAIKASFNGETKGIISLFPDRLKPSLERNFSKDHITLFATINKIVSGLKVDGVVSVVAENADNIDTISFGVELEKGIDHILPESSAERLQAIKELIPNISSPKELLVGQVINPESDVAGFRLRNGWFKAQHISLEKYLAPFMFADEQLKISGTGDFSGYIDLNQMAIEYEGNDVALEGPHFVMQTNRISKVIDPLNGKIHDAVHFIDFAQGTSFGLIPIRDGSYQERNQGLNFTKINADVLMEGRKIHITDAEALVEGLKIAGNIGIDLGPVEASQFDLDMNQAKLTLGNKDYIANATIHFDNLKEDKGKFDLSIHDSSGEVGRLAGTMSGIDPNKTLIELNHELTHYTDVYPEEFRIIINKESAEADLEVHFKYDQLSFEGHLKPREGRLFFEDIQYNYGNALSLLLDGEILPSQGVIEALAKEVKLDLNKMDVFDACKEFATSWHPEGTLTGKGKIHFETKEEAPGWRSEAILNVSLKDWAIKNFSFGDAQDVSCHFISDKSVTYRNVLSSFKSYGKIKLEMTSFDFDKDLFTLEDMHFEVPAEQLSTLANNLADTFPEMFGPAVIETISEVKSTGTVSGAVSIKNIGEENSIKLALDEGIYQFMGAEHDLKDFVLQLNQNILNITSKYHYENHRFAIDVISSSPTLEEGDLVLTGLNNHEVMNISWKKDPMHGFAIKHAQGEFSGLLVDLSLDETTHRDLDEFLLNGTVKVNGYGAANLFPAEIREKFITWSVGDGYLLKGNWFVLRDLSSSGKVRFSGLLLGKDFELAGFQFDTLTSKLEYTPTSISIKDFKISDESGSFTAEKIQMGLNDDFWYFSIPEVMVTKFRPSALRLVGFNRPTHQRPLIIREFQLKDFQGKVSDPASYTGEGELVFTNKSKNPLQNTIFDVPAEILARIGLDLSVMTPVTGTILYDITNGYIHLKKFKDMFSERKLSKFYLSNQHISTMDFNGNLNLQIRMKQYNLLFKLTEPFAVNIHGPFTNPTYRVNAEGKIER